MSKGAEVERLKALDAFQDAVLELIRDYHVIAVGPDGNYGDARAMFVRDVQKSAESILRPRK